MSDDTQSAKDLFLEAVELGDEARSRLLEKLRAERPELAARVERLFAGHARMQALLPSDAGLGEELPPVVDASGVVLGDYELLEQVASGASGVVYRAHQRSLDRVVAVKLLRSGRLATEAEVDGFRHEAEAIARLDDPWIVSVHEVGDGQLGPFFSMKWLEGGSLADLATPIGPEQAARLVLQVARSVHHAHQRGILHRDLKPSNILLDAQGAPHVADFGIARPLEPSAAGPGGPRRIAGTPAYMAPEQTRSDGELSVGTDVWALGCILHALLAGRPRFDGGSTHAVFERIRVGEPEPLPPETPRALAAIVARCTEKDPERRYPSANAVALDLDRWLAHEPILGAPTTPRERFLLWVRREPRLAGAVATVAVLLSALTVGATWASLRMGEHLERAREAEAAANERLGTSLWMQARARRTDGRAGRRAESLDLLRQAAALGSGAGLRDDAIAALALVDLAVDARWPHAEPYAVAFAPDLAIYASGDSEGAIELREASTGEVLRAFPGRGVPCWELAFSPDARRLASKHHGEESGGVEGLELWDLETGERLAHVPGAVASFLFAPGDELVVTLTDGTVLVHDAETGAERARRWTEGNLYRFSVSPAGDRAIVSRWPEKDLVLATWPGLEELARLEWGHTSFAFAWAPEERTVFVAVDDFRVHALDTDTLEEQPRAFRGHGAEVVDAHLSPSGEFLATYSWDNTTRLWEAATGNLLLEARARCIGFGDDGRLAFRTNTELGLWRVGDAGVVRTLHGHAGKNPGRISFSPDGRRLLSVGGGEAILWDVASGRRLASLASPELRTAIFDASGDLLVVDAGGVDRVPVPASDEALRAEGPGPPARLLDGDFRTLDRTPDGRTVAVLEFGMRGVRVLERGARGEPLGATRLEAYTGTHWPTLDPSGRWLATGNWHGVETRVRVWDLASGEPAADLCAGDASTYVAFDPSGRALVTGSGQTYRVFRTGAWEEVRTFARPIELGLTPNPLGFGPGGLVLLMAEDQVVRVHDLEAGELFASFSSPSSSTLTAVAIDDAGRHLAVATRENRVELWDLRAVLAHLEGLGLGAPELAERLAAGPRSSGAVGDPGRSASTAPPPAQAPLAGR